MRAIDFTFWLQGYIEITASTSIGVDQWSRIVNKLDSVVGEGNCDPYSHTLMPGNFVTWLRGFVDIAKRAVPFDEEWQVIKEHLQLVFAKVTPLHNPKKKDENLSTPIDIEEIKKALDRASRDYIHPIPWPKPPYDVTCGPKFCATPSANALTDYPEYPPEVLSES